MQTIRDDNGKEWRINVNAVTIERVRSDTGADLLAMGMEGPEDDPRDGLLFRFRGDPIFLARALFSLCYVEAETRGVEWEEFGAAFCGDRLDAARIALEEETVNFTPDPKIRRVVQTATETLREWMDRGTAQAQKNLDSPKLQQAQVAALKKLDDSFGNLLDDLAESSPDPLPTANSSSPSKPPTETAGITPP